MNDFLARAGYTIFHPKLHPYACPYGGIRPAFLLFSKIVPSTIPYGSILRVDGSARFVAAIVYFFVHAPISRFFATFRDLFSGIIKILKDQEQLQIYTVVAASTSPLSGSGSITPVRLTAHHVYSQVQIMSPGFEFSYTQKIHGPL